MATPLTTPATTCDTSEDCDLTLSNELCVFIGTLESGFFAVSKLKCMLLSDPSFRTDWLDQKVIFADAAQPTESRHQTLTFGQNQTPPTRLATHCNLRVWVKKCHVMCHM